MAKEEEKQILVVIREFAMEDLKAVEEMEMRCDVSPSGAAAATDASSKAGGKRRRRRKKKRSMSLYVDLLGDPLSRVRHCSDHVMLVAEMKKEIVGVIRACIKIVTRGREDTAAMQPAYVKAAYLLGLRVSPTHRRLGIGTKLVERVESWCTERGAEYAYMATDPHNSASLGLFTHRFGYARFRSPVLLAHPVHAHALSLSSSVSFLRLPPPAALDLYSRLFPPSAVEFLPSDLPTLLSNPLTIATFVAIPCVSSSCSATSASALTVNDLPLSFAVMSLWDSTRLFNLRVCGASAAARTALALLRALDARVPWMRLPSIGNIFRPFGVYIMYGLHMEGPQGPHLMRSLCRLAHNMALAADQRCAAVVAEVGRQDPVRAAVPHWKRFSCEEDVWCMKRLRSGGKVEYEEGDNWVTSEPATEVIFVDPREF